MTAHTIQTSIIRVPFYLNKKIKLPASKSMSNRALIIQALSGQEIKITNLSAANDTVILSKLLKDKKAVTWDVGIAGTVMRFLTGFACTLENEIILTGSSRMLERPIGSLVNGLKELGAEIEYLSKEEFPPIKVYPSNLKGGKIKMSATVSSQFISSIMMIAPIIKNGVEIELVGEVLSKPYIDLTSQLLKFFGVDVTWDGKNILVPEQDIKGGEIEIESDWSSASYWYLIATMLEVSEIELDGLKGNSWQGDRVVKDIFKEFGVYSNFKENSVLIRRDPLEELSNEFNYDFSDCPDLAQTVVAAMLATNKHGVLTGLQTLRVKETDRINALQLELSKLGVETTSTESTLTILPFDKLNDGVTIETYNDHRMALAFAPLGLILNDLKIENPGVVNKSYPNFWEDLAHAGIVYE